MVKKNIVLFCQGGMGDVIMHTPIIRYFRHVYPDDHIVVAGTYSHLFQNNPNIDEIVSLQSDFTNLYARFVLPGNCRFFKKHFLYDHLHDEAFLKDASTMLEFTCNCYQAEYDGKGLDYFVSEKEAKIADVFLGQYDKPVVLIHATGSIPSEGQPHKVHGHKDLDFELVSRLIDKYKEQYYFLHIGLQGEPVIPNAIDALGIPFREAAAMIPKCKTFIAIESIFAHLSSAFRKTGVVCFMNTHKDFFGYPHNINISVESCDCGIWPCLRPVGALLDLQEGYTNPKTRERVLWTCKDQKCKKIPFETLEKAFLEAVKRNDPVPVAKTVEEARKQ